MQLILLEGLMDQWKELYIKISLPSLNIYDMVFHMWAIHTLHLQGFQAMYSGSRVVAFVFGGFRLMQKKRDQKDVSETQFKPQKSKADNSESVIA